MLGTSFRLNCHTVAGETFFSMPGNGKIGQSSAGFLKIFSTFQLNYYFSLRLLKQEKMAKEITWPHHTSTISVLNWVKCN